MLVQPAQNDMGRHADFLKLGADRFRVWKADTGRGIPGHAVFPTAIATWAEMVSAARMRGRDGSLPAGSLLLADDGQLGVVGIAGPQNEEFAVAFDLRTGAQMSKGDHNTIVITRWQVALPAPSGGRQVIWDVDVRQ